MLMQAVDSYLRLRRTAGFQLRYTETLLKDFARFAAERGELHIRTETAIAWAQQSTSLQERARRLSSITLFARHVRAEDKNHQIPPEGVFGHRPRSRRLPYIFTPAQVAEILAEALRLPPAGSLRPHTYCTLFGLLAACGLRISEALALQLDDIGPDGLRIRDTKFRKSRLVPLHPTAASQLALYVHRRQDLAGAESRLFVSLRSKPLRYPTVIQTFLFLVRKLGLRSGPGEPGPRLHDLRHTFAVRALERCPERRSGIPRHMLALSTYLGHARITDTYWYLQTTPHLMTDIADACEAHLEGRQP